MKLTKRLAFAIAITLSAGLYANGIEVPDVDPLTALLQLFTQWKVLAPLAKASLAIVILVQSVKKMAPGFAYLRPLTIVSGIVYGLLQSLSNGMSLFDSAVFVLITSGGAMLLYDMFKNPLNAMFKVRPQT